MELTGEYHADVNLLMEEIRQLNIRDGGKSSLITSIGSRLDLANKKCVTLVKRNDRLKWQRNGTRLKLDTAEQRNADAIRLLTALYNATDIVWPDVADFLTMNKPAELGADQ